MLTLGISGGFSEIEQDFIPNLPSWYYHDSAAVLMDNGKVVAAAEEERLNRIKHTSKFCAKSLRYCLEQYQVKLSDIDYISFYFAEDLFDNALKLEYIKKSQNMLLKYSRELIIERLEKEFGYQFPSERIIFTSHHQAHAYSTYFHSGFDEALIIVVDGRGESESITILSGQGKQLKTFKRFPVEISLGDFYESGTQLLGYSLFDEYKVMGLAPYGNPERFRSQFQTLYDLLPNGWYSLHLWGMYPLFLKAGFVPRRKGEKFNQDHKDFAASLQEALETITKHILTHWQKVTGHKKLCMAGGVAHNCSMNGKLLNSGLFDEIFVHPASHDAGAAIGAAMIVDQNYNQSAPLPLVHIYWGPDVGSDEDVQSVLEEWKDFLDFRRMENTPVEVAKLIAEGAVIGWVQGKTEFGPRALGNRSILADPRVAENKTRINAMVKKRESYRPFAPSVIVEAADEFFELPQNASSFGYMVFAVKVKEDKRQLLGAITHVDGTARIQTVSKTTNSKYWNLINEFGKVTQVPILLNTSFNNNVEPIVNSCLEAITCFLTTNLNYLVINDFLIGRLDVNWQDYYQKMIPNLVASARLREVSLFNFQGQASSYNEIYFNYSDGKSLLIMPETYKVLQNSDRQMTIEQSFISLRISKSKLEELTNELIKLWENRFIILKPSRNEGQSK